MSAPQTRCADVDVTDVTDAADVVAAACRMRATRPLSTTTTSLSPCRIETSPRAASCTQNMTGCSALTAGWPAAAAVRSAAFATDALNATIGTATAAPAVVLRRVLRDQSLM